MINTIFVPLLTLSDSFPSDMTEDEKNQRATKIREFAESELNKLIESGWTLFHSERVEDESGLYVAYTMYKPDQVGAQKPIILSNKSKASTMNIDRRRKFTNC